MSALASDWRPQFLPIEAIVIATIHAFHKMLTPHVAVPTDVLMPVVGDD